MWSRDSNLDTRANALYVPNRFVPLFAKELGNSGLDSVKSKQNHPNATTLGPQKKAPPSTSRKGKRSFSLQDFWFPFSAKTSKRMQDEKKTKDKLKMEDEKKIKDKMKMQDEKKMNGK